MLFYNFFNPLLLVEVGGNMYSLARKLGNPMATKPHNFW